MSEDSQEQILDATMQVIVREGLDSTSMRAVAEEADVSLGLLSYHFEGKEQLIVAAFRRATERLITLIDDEMAAAGDDPLDRLRAALRSWFDPSFSDAQHLEMWLAIWAVSRTNDEDAAARDLAVLAVDTWTAATAPHVLASGGDLDGVAGRAEDGGVEQEPEPGVAALGVGGEPEDGGVGRGHGGG